MSLDQEQFARARHLERLREAEDYRLAQQCMRFEARFAFYRGVLYALGRWMKQTGECLINRSGRGDSVEDRGGYTMQQEAHAHR